MAKPQDSSEQPVISDGASSSTGSHQKSAASETGSNGSAGTTGPDAPKEEPFRGDQTTLSLNADGKAITAGHTTLSDQVKEASGKADTLVGHRIADKWQLDHRIGKGGMSVVYKAHHVQLGKIVAVKLLLPHLVEEMKSQQRFAREAKAASSLSHPNVMTVHDYGMTEDGEAYIIMDYLDGHSLGDYLQQNRHLPAEQACEVFYQTALGLQHAHSRGVIHRDLKPSNLMLVQNEGKLVVKIVDFGIAKVAIDYETGGQNLTKTGEVFGSPYYMSPEQCKGKQTDARSDIYSMGCLMYEALSGKPPFIGENSLDTMFQHLNEEPNWLVRHNVPDSLMKRLDEIVQKCLEKHPADRYQSAEELASDLQNARTLSAGAWRSKALAAKTHRVRKARAGLTWRLIQASKIAGVVLAALAVCMWLYFQFGAHFSKRVSYRLAPLADMIEPPPPVQDEDTSLRHTSPDGMLSFEQHMGIQTYETKIGAWRKYARMCEAHGMWDKAAEASLNAVKTTKELTNEPSNAEAFDHYEAGKCFYFLARSSTGAERFNSDLKAENQLGTAYKIIRGIILNLMHDGVSESNIPRHPAAPLLVRPLKFLEQVYEDEDKKQPAMEACAMLMSLHRSFQDADDLPSIAFRYADLFRRQGTDLGNSNMLESAQMAYQGAIEASKNAERHDDLRLAKEHYGRALTRVELSRLTNNADKTLDSKEDQDMKEGIALVKGLKQPQDILLGSMQMDYADMLWSQGQWMDALMERATAMWTFINAK